MDTNIGKPPARTQNSLSPARLQATSYVPKTVTNFASIRYDNNGGLNPVSPEKRGMAREAKTNSVAVNSADWREKSVLNSAKPGLSLDVEERAVSVF